MKKVFFAALVFLFFSITSNATELKEIKVNRNISTHITVGEAIKYVDISTQKVVGDLPIENILRIKPVFPDSIRVLDGETLAVVTIVTDSYKVQFKAVYTDSEEKAATDINFSSRDMKSYYNPDVTMSREDMYKYAWHIWNSSKKYYNVSKKSNRLLISLLNIYTVGDYFFIDLGVQNKSNIKYDVDQIRFKIEDKKQTKSTNFQSVEIKPENSVMSQKFFTKEFRNVYIFKKFTFPDAKVFTIELAEDQISGRTVTLKIDYTDILNADSFSKSIIY